MESKNKLLKITFEYSNGSKLELNAEDLDKISDAVMFALDKYFEAKKTESQRRE
jgi:hypothetical protein